jgi:hypothetical protein
MTEEQIRNNNNNIIEFYDHIISNKERTVNQITLRGVVIFSNINQIHEEYYLYPLYPSMKSSKEISKSEVLKMIVPYVRRIKLEKI